MNYHSLVKIAVALCIFSVPAVAQDGGQTGAPDNSGDQTSPITLSLEPNVTAFDIRDIQFSAGFDKGTFEAGMKKGNAPIRLTIANHGTDAVSFSSAATIPGECVEIYAVDETYHNKLIFPSAKSSKGKPAMIEVAPGKTVSVLITAPLPSKLLNPKYKGYEVCVRVYVPRLEHTFEIYSDSFQIPPPKPKAD